MRESWDEPETDLSDYSSSLQLIRGRASTETGVRLVFWGSAHL